MTEPDRGESEKSFDERLRDLQTREPAQNRYTKGFRAAQQSGLGLAFRVGVELVAGVIVGLAIGWALDEWLGTRPWLMLVFILLGGAAGILNVYKVAQGYDETVGYHRATPAQKDQSAGAEPDKEPGPGKPDQGM
ncbi:MAG: AtpZ/AtpI family protein [Magnetovibrionaceae bacterium]